MANRRKEQIFLRVKGGNQTGVGVMAVPAELAFEVNGQRFFFHSADAFHYSGFARITDGRTGNLIGHMSPMETKEEFIQRAEKMVRDNWDKYMAEVKKVQKEQKIEIWGRIR